MPRQLPSKSKPKKLDAMVKWRELTGYTQAELAKILGVTAQTVYNYERGFTKPNKLTWEAMKRIHPLAVQ